MRTALDTNIISALWANEVTAPWIVDRLEQVRLEGPIIVSAPVFAELLAYPHITPAIVSDFLEEESCQVDFALDRQIWQTAGEAYAAYAKRRRQSGGEPKRLITDFIIGAHALLKTEQLLTLDAARYKKSFPDLMVLSPEHA